MRRRVSVLAVALLVGLLASATWFAYARARDSAAHRHSDRGENAIPQPKTWVPFTADVAVTLPNGERQRGKHYRRGDGSGRLDITSVERPEAALISINNISEATYYRFSPKLGWISGPMRLPPGRFNPPQWHLGMVGLQRYPFRLALRAGETQELQADKGFEAYAYLTPKGTPRLVVPDLNFFAVVNTSVRGRREAYTNIVIGEPDPNLFRPPAGAKITRTSKIDGVIARPHTGHSEGS